MADTYSAVLSLPEHPFLLAVLLLKDQHEFPQAMPFNLRVHPKYAIPALIVSEEIRTALENAYSTGSFTSTPLGESSLASDRMAFWTIH